MWQAQNGAHQADGLSGAFNWPIWVAQDRDLFAENGVSVQVEETPGSVVQWTSLAKGHSDLAITLMDNVVAYREGQGEAPVTVPDAIAVMASDATVMPTLVTRPDIKSYADLKGRSLSRRGPYRTCSGSFWPSGKRRTEKGGL